VRNRFGLLLLAAVAFAIAAKPTEHLFQGAGQGNLATVLPAACAAVFLSGAGVLFMVLAAGGRLSPRRLRVALAVGFLFAALPPLNNAAVGGKYGVDSASHTRYAAGLLLEGKHPYRDFDVHASYTKYPVSQYSITYHDDGSALNAYTYPAGAFLIDLPFEALGLDIRWLYALSGVALLGLVVWLAPPAVALLALGYAVLHSFLSLWTAGAGVGEPLWTLLVALAWLLRAKPTTSALAMGAALTIKQLSWFFFPFWVLSAYHQGGVRAAIRAAVISGGVFAATNLPFAVTDPQGWLQGTLGPMLFPLPVMGFGLARLGTLLLPDWPKTMYTALEVAALLGGLVLFFKRGRQLPTLAMVLPWVPLWLAWRSLSSYFYMLPLLVLIVLFAQFRLAPALGAEAARNRLRVLTESVALTCIAAVVLSIGFWYEAGLLWDELVANKIGQLGRAGLAGVGILLSGCSIGIIVAVALGAIRPWLRIFATFSGFLGLSLMTAAAIHALPDYTVDTAAAVHRGAELVLEGKHPYQDFNLTEAATAHRVPDKFITKYRDGTPMEELAYPAGSFLAVVPFVAAGLGDVRIINGISQLLLIVLLFALAPPPYKLLALALPMSSHLLSFMSIAQGYNEPAWLLLLLLAWVARERPLASGVLMGLAMSIKQITWFFTPFWVMALWMGGDRRGALRASALAAATFLAVNLPFAAGHPALWLRSLLAPMSGALPVMGFGPSQLGALLLGPDASLVFTALEVIAGLCCLAAYWRWGRQYPELALVLPILPLWFAWRSIFSYYYLIPLLLGAALMLRQRRLYSATAEAAAPSAPPPLSAHPASP